MLTARVVGRSALVLCLFFVAVGGRAQQSFGAAAPQNEPAPAVLRITTREVLIDVVATDDRNHPTRDLGEREIEIVELDFGIFDLREFAPPDEKSGGVGAATQ